MEKEEKRVVQIEIDDEVRKLTIEGVDKDAQVVMRQELSDDELDDITGGCLLNFGQGGTVGTVLGLGGCPAVCQSNSGCNFFI